GRSRDVVMLAVALDELVEVLVDVGRLLVDLGAFGVLRGLPAADRLPAAVGGCRLLLVVQFAARPPDRPLQLFDASWKVWACELGKRLGGVALVRRPALGPAPLARGDDEPAGVLLGGDHHERAAVKLAGGLGAVDELRRVRRNSSYAGAVVMP